MIFSKDRAAQLDLLLRTWIAFVAEPTSSPIAVVYTYSEKIYFEGYGKLFDKYRWVRWIEQVDDFKTVLNNNRLFEHDFTMFLVDDDVFINPFYGVHHVGIPRLYADDSIICLSLRMHPGIRHCYAYESQVNPPRIHGNVWDWDKAPGDFGYPMSLDGHIYRTDDIAAKIRNLPYANPNQLEGELAGHPIERPRMLGVSKPVIVGVPWNKVQKENDNRDEGHSAKEMNAQFLSGKQIDYSPFIGIHPEAAHVAIPMEMK